MKDTQNRNRLLTIGDVMTTQPHTIGFDIPFQKALDSMSAHKVRHLPVLKGGKLVGVVSDRDLRLALAIPPEQKITMEDLMQDEPVAVPASTPLKEVLGRMREQKIGSVIVTDSVGRVAGIFTSIDALKLLEDRLVR